MIKVQHAKNMRFLHNHILMVLLVFFMPVSLLAQNNKISGRVLEDGDLPVIGATVFLKNSTSGTITDIDGRYSIDAPADGVLEFRFLGLETQEVKINGRTEINITMGVDKNIVLDEVVVVGYGTQKKVTLTGAVAGIKGKDMIKTKNENPQNMLTGRIAGVRVWQKSSEPGTYNNDFDIRGMGAPLVVIDGIPRDVTDFQRLNPNDIEDISVLKDAAAAIYGVRSANGVVLVTTKKGSKDGKTSVSYNGSFTIQKPSRMPKLADALQTMTIYNEKTMNNVDGGHIRYTEKDFDDFRNGTRRATDWNKLIFSDTAPQTQHDLSITGGNDKTQFYVGLGYFFQEGFFKSKDLNYDKFNLRSNITTEITKGLKFDLSLSGLIDDRNSPYSDAPDIIRNYWAQGVLNPAYADPENTMLNYEGLDLEQNTVAMMDADVSGYKKFKQKHFQSSASLIYDFGTHVDFLKGLSAKALFSFDHRADDNTMFRREYSLYAYNQVTNSYDPKLYNNSSPTRMKRESFSKQQTLAQFLLNYNRTFNEVHSVASMIGWETQKQQGDNFFAQRNLAFDKEYLFAGVEKDQIGNMYSGDNDLYERTFSALMGRINYAYDNRYIAEFQFRYDGTSRFSKGNQWGFFPSASIGWRLSEEPFFKSLTTFSFVDQLKFRASYGSVADVRGLNQEWVMGYTYPGGGPSDDGYFNGYAPGFIFDGEYITGVKNKPLPNKKITWPKSKTFNIGIDFEGWNGLFGFVIDYFDRRTTGIYARRSTNLPTVVGAEAPHENLNSKRQFGIDLELTHRNKVGDVSYNVKAIGTITREKYLIAAQNGAYGNSYDKWRHDNLNNRYQGIVFGYESAGRYDSWNDVWSYPIYKDRDVLPGDYKYKDWNGDGQIDGLDEHPYAFDQTPWLNYSFSFDIAYKGFDFSALFQGSALGSMEYKEPLYSIWGTEGGGTLEQYLDRWHPVDPKADPYDPATEWIGGHYAYTGRYPKSNSSFNTVSTAYLRLKSVELGYTLPKLKSSPSLNLRVFANAYNLFTITRLKFVDPEHPSDDLGRLYPLNKTYTVGASLTF